MAEPVTMTIAATVKEAAEKMAIESLKLSKELELSRQNIEQLRIKEINNMKELHRNPTDDVKANYKYLFNEVDKVKADPELRPSFMNRFVIDPNLIGQSGEIHGELLLIQYCDLERQVLVETNRGNFIVDFVGKLFKDMPIETLEIKDGALKTMSEVIPKDTTIGVEIKNGLSELRRNVEHVINQALAAKKEAGHGFIGISKTMAETISKKPDLYSDFFNRVAENDLRVIITQPTMTQQILNLLM